MSQNASNIGQTASSLFNDGAGDKEINDYMTAVTYVMSPQSSGTVTLRSSNSLDAPKIDPMFFSHPFDRRVLIEGMKMVLDLLEATPMKACTIQKINWPADRSDQGILVGRPLPSSCVHSSLISRRTISSQLLEVHGM